MRKKESQYSLYVAGILASFVLTLHPLVGLAHEDTSAPEPVSYTFISVDIPNPRGEFGFTSLSDINNGGEITGAFTNSSGFGFLLGKAFRSTDIQCPGVTINALLTVPRSINNRGEIAGSCFVSGRYQGFLRDKEGTYTLLNFPDAILTEAHGINDDSQVVGVYRDSAGGFHGFFWDAGLFIPFDVPFPNATFTFPTGINTVGQIVGFWSDVLPFNNPTHGFVLDRGVFRTFDVPGAVATLLVDINDRGQIVGVYGDSDNILHSFLLEDGHLTNIEVPFPLVVFTDVAGINDRGQIVGRYLTTNTGDVSNPFFSHGVVLIPRGVAQHTTVSRAAADATPALRLALGTCPGVELQEGLVTPAKLMESGIFCSQAVAPQ